MMPSKTPVPRWNEMLANEGAPSSRSLISPLHQQYLLTVVIPELPRMMVRRKCYTTATASAIDAGRVAQGEGTETSPAPSNPSVRRPALRPAAAARPASLPPGPDSPGADVADHVRR